MTCLNQTCNNGIVYTKKHYMHIKNELIYWQRISIEFYFKPIECNTIIMPRLYKLMFYKYKYVSNTLICTQLNSVHLHWDNIYVCIACK